MPSSTLIYLLAAIPLAAQTPDPTSTDQKIQELERKIDELDQRVKAQDTADKARTSVNAGTGGITIRSNDEDFVLKIGLDAQVDNRTFLGGSNANLMDQIVIRRARTALSGTVFKYVDFYLRPDFGLGQTILYDAYFDMKYFSRFNLRVGKFKPPVGLERLQSDDDTNFIERGLPTLLVPSRDIGYQVSGDVIKQKASYAVGVFNGVPDNSLSDASASNHRDYAGRIFLTPVSGLGVGIGATTGNVNGLALPSYKTFGQASFFTFAPGVTSIGHRTRLAPQAYYYLGPFGLFTEYTLAEEGFQKGALRRDIAFRSWQVQATYLLTGEKKGFSTLTPRNKTWGAVELAVRVGDFSAERGIYDYGFVSAATTPRHAHEWVGGASWYLNRALRVSLNYGNTNFSGGIRPSERAILQRFQFSF